MRPQRPSGVQVHVLAAALLMQLLAAVPGTRVGALGGVPALHIVAICLSVILPLK